MYKNGTPFLVAVTAVEFVFEVFVHHSLCKYEEYEVFTSMRRLSTKWGLSLQNKTTCVKDERTNSSTARNGLLLINFARDGQVHRVESTAAEQ